MDSSIYILWKPDYPGKTTEESKGEKSQSSILQEHFHLLPSTMKCRQTAEVLHIHQSRILYKVNSTDIFIPKNSIVQVCNVFILMPLILVFFSNNSIYLILQPVIDLASRLITFHSCIGNVFLDVSICFLKDKRRLISSFFTCVWPDTGSTRYLCFAPVSHTFS